MDSIPARQRIDMLFDSFDEQPVAPGLSDPIGFPGYREILANSSAEAVVWGIGRMGAYSVVAVVFEFGFLGGSMGSAVGATLDAAMHRSLADRLPFLAVTTSGGARMQEGMVALGQMPRTIAASVSLADSGIPRITILGHPTTGGVYASFASLSDVLLADAGATIGFAGPRVAAAITGASIPEGSHTAETAFLHGLVDAVIPPQQMKEWIAPLLHILSMPSPLITPPLELISPAAGEAWDEFALARHSERPTNSLYIASLFSQLFLLHGDRMGGNDPGVITGLARFAERPVVLIALNGTHPNASGYRKAQFAIKLAGRLHLPLITMVDTPGADPSYESEYSGVAGEIARTFEAMLTVDTPIIAIVTGEGGSGGALALACGDVVAIQQHAVFSVIAPEGAATILYRDPARAEELAPLLRPTSTDMKLIGIADVVLPEVDEGAHMSRKGSAEVIADWLTVALDSTTADRQARAARFRNLRPLR